MPNCWKCEAPYTELKKTPDFHATCDRCHSYWHSCCNCRFFTGYPTARCKLPNVEEVHDREGANFCDSFELANSAVAEDPQRRNDEARKKWDSLFRD